MIRFSTWQIITLQDLSGALQTLTAFSQVQETDLQQIFLLLLVKISGRCLK